MLTMGRTLFPDYVGAQQVRQDYFRTTVLGGVGEGAWVAGQCEMLVNGAAAAVTFAFGPPAAESYVIDRVIVGLVCGTGPGVAEFANLGAALANGIDFQILRTTPAETTGLFTLLTNSDFMRFGARNLQDDTVNAFIVSTWSGAGADMPMVLHGQSGDQLQLVVNDNMTLVGGTTMWAYGHAHVLS